jgi:hypothetical protein
LRDEGHIQQHWEEYLYPDPARPHFLLAVYM